MGQYWQIINIDKRQTLGHLGKLGEFYYSSVPAGLVPLLATPLEPTVAAPEDLLGSWAGDRVVCVGDYADSLPTGLLTPAEQDALKDGGGNLYHYASRHYVRVRAPRATPALAAAAFPPERTWVLRNLSRRTYVRGDALGPRHPGLGHLLLACICFSDDGDPTMDVDLTDGAWVGCRFDITAAEQVEGAGDAAGWQDVSAEMAAYARWVWDSQK